MQEGLEIRPQSVHVWIAHLSRLKGLLADRRSLLSEPERCRSDRFSDVKAAERYVTVHTLFRLLLGAYLEVSPAAVHYRTGALGAPLPLVSAGGRSFCWSLSYRDEYALYGVSADGPIGVDIERIQPDAAEDLAEQCLGAGERAAVGRLGAQRRTRQIFQLWTIKEAVLKRAGLGVSLPPDEVEVNLTSVERPAIVLPRPRGEELAAVTARLLDAPQGYIAAVAMDPELTEVVMRPLDDAAVESFAQ